MLVMDKIGINLIKYLRSCGKFIRLLVIFNFCELKNREVLIFIKN